MTALRRDFSSENLLREMQAEGVDAAIVVQARQSVAETEALLAEANASAHIAGVVGWLPLQDRRATESALETLSSEPKLVGVRHVVQGEAPGFLDGSGFQEGMLALSSHGLLYELLIRESQLAEAMRLVDRHPDQVFVLDHIAKPRIASGEIEPWASGLKDLARRPHVSCKLSGLVTEAEWHHWSPAVLLPYLDIVLEAFGPTRVLAGSDWPVCLLASSYGRWWAVLRKFFAEYKSSECDGIFGENAVRIYGLPSLLPVDESA